VVFGKTINGPEQIILLAVAKRFLSGGVGALPEFFSRYFISLAFVFPGIASPFPPG